MTRSLHDLLVGEVSVLRVGKQRSTAVTGSVYP